MKRLWIAMMSVIISLSLYLPVQAATVYSDGYFYYHAYEGYNSICGYFGKETTVVVPSSIAGRPVSRIEAGAFDGCSTIEKLVLPDTIMEIEDGAFAGAKNLKEIEDASGVWKSQGTGENSGSEGSQENPTTPSGSGNSENPGGTGNPTGVDSYEYEDTGDGQGTDGQTPAIGSGTGLGTQEPEGSGSTGEDGEASGDRSTSGKENAGNENKSADKENDRQNRHGISGILWAVIVVAAVILLAVAGILIWRRRRG